MSPRRLLALLAAALLAPAAARAGDDCRPPFNASDSYKFPSQVENLAVADVNVDGLPDLVVISFYSGAPTVRLGEADGGFGPSIFGPLATSNQSMVVDSFTNDQAPDVVVTGGQGTLFLRGNGDGTFEDPVEIVPVSYHFAISGDLNDDGKRDLVVISPENHLAVLLGNGDGTFQGPVATDPGQMLSRVAVGDLDGDDLGDVVATQVDADGVLVFLGRGDGHFETPVAYPTGWFSHVLALADISGDSSPDVLSGTGDAVAVQIGNGDGTLQAAVIYTVGSTPAGISAGDFDGDGLLDPVAVLDIGFDGRPGTVVILRNTGAGVLVAGREFLGTDNATPPSVADFGDDGLADVAVGGEDGVSVLRGNGDGTLRGVRFTMSGQSRSLHAPGDFDGDGRTDFATAQNGELRAELSVGGGWFSPGPAEFLGDAAALAVGDFDGDGLDDAAILNSTVAFLTVALSAGDGSFGPPIGSPMPDNAYEGTLVATDFDGDGILDLVSAQNRPGEPGDLYALRGRGDGTFETAVETPLTEPPGLLLSGDFDEDGKDDLALRDKRFASNTVRVFLSLGDGTYEEHVVTDSATTGALAAVDLRNSGHLDLLTGSDLTFTIWPGLGDGNFGAPVTIAAGAVVDAIDTADFGGDGQRDVITAGQGESSVLMGIPGGGFQAPIVYLVGGGEQVFARDYDGNGWPDGGYTIGFYDSALSVLLNAELGAAVSSVSAVAGTAATLQARAGGFGPLTYQWRKDGAGLSDGGSISGSTTATLTIDPVSFQDAGAYDVVVTDSCGQVTSNAASLSVEFADVAVSSPFHDDILTIATEGITGGCGGGNYCPTNPVRRDQMAVFLLKAEHGSDYTPPPCTGVFDDVPCPGPFTDWVEQLAAEGVTGGCGTDVYCPDKSVTRAQMAIFLLKTSEGSGYTPPEASGIFGDVPIGSFGADFIEDLYNRGITGGCSITPLLYCPGSAVLRQQMATLLVKTFFP